MPLIHRLILRTVAVITFLFAAGCALKGPAKVHANRPPATCFVTASDGNHVIVDCADLAKAQQEGH